MSQYDDKSSASSPATDYKPITLKAMSRRFEVGADDYAEFRSAVKALVKDGQARPGQGQDADARPPRRRRARSSARSGGRRRGSGSSGRRSRTGKDEDIFIPPDAGRDASSGDEVAVKITKRSHTPGMNHEGRIVQVLARASGVFVGTYFEEGRRGLRQGRRHDVPRPDLRRRPRREGGQARRQGRPRDGPLPDARARGRGGHHRDPRPARPAGRRHARPSSARSTSPTSSTTRPSTRPASRPSSSTRTKSATASTSATS